MTSRLNPYLSFIDNAREAMEFYRSVFGGELTVNTYGDFQGPGNKDLIMHAQLETPSGFVLMGSDIAERGPLTRGNTMTISLSGADEAEFRGYWDKLTADGGVVTLPLEKAPWGDSFGQCTDKYGFDWMVNIAGKQA